MSEICYKKNCLSSVIVRTDFFSPLKEIENSFDSVLYKQVLALFPIPEPRTSFTHELKLSQNNVETQREQFTEWRFHSKSRSKTVIFSPTAIIISYAVYSSYEEVKGDFSSVFNMFSEKYPATQVARIGIRYINNIEMIYEKEPTIWNSYINSNLIKSFDFFPQRKEYLSRLFQNIEYNFGDFVLRFQCGMHNPDYPDIIKKKVFILDYDAFRQGAVDSAELASFLGKMHDCIQKTFEESITDEYRQFLNN
ncbi:MAG: TIGR04255 family protein [Oligoflexia bacterium]|nr:TIGR04255 family protein [Oligoflexia bacterium]